MNSEYLRLSPSAILSNSSVTSASSLETSDSVKNKESSCNQYNECAFGRTIQLVLDPISKEINQVNPRKIKMLEILASSIQESSTNKSNYERVISVVSSAPAEKRSAVLLAFSKFLTSNRIVDINKANEICQGLNGVYNSVEGSGVLNPIEDLQRQEEEAIRHKLKERKEFLKILEKHVEDIEPEWLEDTTHIERVAGGINLHLGKPGTDQATGVIAHFKTDCLKNDVTYKSLFIIFYLINNRWNET